MTNEVGKGISSPSEFNSQNYFLVETLDGKTITVVNRGNDRQFRNSDYTPKPGIQLHPLHVALPDECKENDGGSAPDAEPKNNRSCYISSKTVFLDENDKAISPQAARAVLNTLCVTSPDRPLNVARFAEPSKAIQKRLETYGYRVYTDESGSGQYLLHVSAFRYLDPERARAVEQPNKPANLAIIFSAGEFIDNYGCFYNKGSIDIQPGPTDSSITFVPLDSIGKRAGIAKSVDLATGSQIDANGKPISVKR